MPVFEYKVVPAPAQGKKSRGVKGTSARFAHGLEAMMNDLGAEGWEYLRSDTLPCEERVGLTGRTTTFQNMLVFRRVKDAGDATMGAVTALLPAPTPSPKPVQAPAPAVEAPQAAPHPEPALTKASAAAAAAAAALSAQPPVNSGAPSLGPANQSNADVAAE